jgi:hypothetical protein
MTRLPAAGLLLIIFATTPATAQFSGFMSAGYGYNSNPLYNYEELSDQLRQSYLELGYVHQMPSARLQAVYVGGLTLFNRFEGRNYYEHSVAGQYLATLSTIPARDDEEEYTGDNPFSSPDSSDTELGIDLRLGARHDKTEYEVFDNFGAGLGGFVRWAPGAAVRTRVLLQTGLRNYNNLDVLSNITTELHGELTTRPGRFTAGVRAGGGFKHYTEELVDTSLYADPSGTTKTPGKGKGGAKVQPPGGSKNLLANAQTTTTWQIVGGVHAASAWNGGTAMAQALYRHNPGSPDRYLTQYASTTMLTEDIYNDHYSWSGPEFRLRVTQALPLGLRAVSNGEYLDKTFGFPALSLLGEPVAAERNDNRFGIDIYLSRFIPVGGSVGLDVALGAEYVSNASNDEYNDYSTSSVTLSLGVGF